MNYLSHILELTSISEEGVASKLQKSYNYILLNTLFLSKFVRAVKMYCRPISLALSVIKYSVYVCNFFFECLHTLNAILIKIQSAL